MELRSPMVDAAQRMTRILFLGTGGARFVVARQIRASGGMWMTFGETRIHVDPGPGALVRALCAVPPCVPAQLDALVLSHKHLDHSNDINVMIEAMTQGGFRSRGVLLAPLDALEGEPVVHPYARHFVRRTEVLKERAGPYQIGDVEVRTSVKHVHAVETYGLHFTYGDLVVSYLPCGRYFEGLIEDYASHIPSVLILNVLRYRDSMDVDHLTFDNARQIIAGVKPKVAIMSHFGTKMLERDPNFLARELEDELGLRVIAARDMIELDVDTEVAAVGR
ncbi:MAG: MBL fold metallo-hydrolase [Candidatus Eremiobacteraeota bacterium]|nr:MBL fold metallo-hydrolase [Candidatus Eremiobacteraeota bacterium]